MCNRPDDPPANDASLRDFFAAAALEGCVEKQFSDALLARLGSTEAASAAIAGAAYQIADACLLARRGGVDPLFAAIEQRDALLAACEEARVHLTGTLRGLVMDPEHLARTLDAALELARRPL
jgi:hypothetical protein